ncbi:ComEC/Rec2 family competence protein [uncultured Hydrogenophaga sp.]|uniref:ComEC/Rec2 family competence protein n=1 Tax=uncultured Hydrogenophaga sp. TaxID=199683 RepID=UPI0025832E78|nr:ComEC/Rec2 family competence protein [uncultured Hydrogenophaga sp.]
MLASPAPSGDDDCVPETPRAWRGGWALAGVVLGCALQLQQSGLWTWWGYAAMVLGGLAALAWRQRLAWLLAGAALAFGVTGLRAAALAEQGLAPALEGRDIAVVGRVASLPVMGLQGERFEFVVERASLDGQAVHLPPRLLLGWYGGPQRDGDRPGGWAVAHRSPGLVAGERWAFEVRLKRAHGSLNPHGFDRERWLWERGILATGYVRAGPRDPAPERLEQSGRHPVDLARQRVAGAMVERLGDSRAAGVLAALAVGEQSAIVGRGKRVVRYGFLSNQPLSQFGGADFENKSFALPKRCNAPAGKKVVRFRVLAAQSLQTCFRSREMLDTGRYTS